MKIEDVHFEKELSVLLVEDVLLNQIIAEEFLKNINATAIVANHGKEAVEILDQQIDFDFILMDLQMPVMDGFEATQIIRANVKLDHIPIIALTANVNEADVKRYFEIGMVDCIPKPIIEEDFKLKIYKSLLKSDSKN